MSVMKHMFAVFSYVAVCNMIGRSYRASVVEANASPKNGHDCFLKAIYI